ncbi:Tagatose 1,6-diphosphate aldolase [Pediococcus damnosus]|uniref:tagatose 1,6-diphosphate aldolase n=1 Tax=Pediococcus damnosus TaxID=51663 RepID=UPI00078D88D8|nr:tagatose 1,6-diphosphate aldolase [Pediococcus damnosus]AMV69423.1 Tagatose 1,6-diphosphate aldolase [Pediococcus damnosus]
MQTKLSRGKFENLQKLADDEGTLTILGLDQRKSFQKAMAQAQEQTGNQFNEKKCYEFKQLVSEYLSPFASGVLLDQELGTEAMKTKTAQAGLITAYDCSEPDNSKNTHFPRLLSNLSLNRLAHTSTNGVKVRIAYNPHGDAQINDQKQAFLERVGAEALAADLPLFIEPVVYDDTIIDRKSAEFAKIRPMLIIDTLKELTKSRYHIDILQIETPIDFNFVDGFTDSEITSVYSKREAAKLFKEASDITTRPFLYESGPESIETFMAAVKFAGQSGAKFAGILAGQSLWQEAIHTYATSDEQGLKTWLETTGKTNLTALNDILENYATPWYDRFGGKKSLDIFDNPIEL